MTHIVLVTSLKKGIILIVFSLLCFSTFAQKNNVNKASSAVMNENYDKAKEYIHLALENTETKLQAKTWYYKGRVYEGLVKRSQETNDTVVDWMQQTVDAYNKAIELDKGEDYKNSAKEKKEMFVVLLMNKLSKPYNNGEFALATKILKVVIHVQPTGENYSYLASSAYACKDYEAAYIGFQKTIDLGKSHENMYVNLFSLANNLGKSYEEQKPYLEDATNLYPTNFRFIHNEIHALEKIEGYSKDSINEKYERILVLNPKDEVALFNLGAHYYNVGVKANNASLIKSEVNALYKKALTYLEIAYKVDPNDASVKSVLKKTYLHLDMIDEAGAL